MKKQILWMVLSAITVSFVLVVGSLAAASGKGGSAARTQQESVQDSSYAASGYVLGTYEGQLALFRENSSVPYQRLELPLSMLSEYDREQVEKGIVVQTPEELRQLVEDLTS